MFERAGKIPYICAIALALAMTMASTGWPVLAAGTNAEMASLAEYNHVVRASGELRALPQKISTHLMFVAKGFEPESNLRILRATRDRFERMLTGLRGGGAELGLPAMTSGEIRAQLDNVANLWRLLDAVVRRCLDSGSVSKDDVSEAAELTTLLTTDLDRVVESYQVKWLDGQMFSTKTISINLSTRQAMLAHRTSTNVLLIAYGHEVRKNKKDLRKTISLFGETLNALLRGNPELHLTRPPTAEITAQLRTIEGIWRDLQPIVNRVAKSGKADAETVAALSQTDLLLQRELTGVIELYEAL